MTAKETAQDTRVAGELVNRTGMAVSPEAGEMRETAAHFRPQGSEQQFRLLRQEARRTSPEPVGTMPPPASLTGVVRDAVRRLGGQKTTVLLDKIGERLAFERTGTRLYETLIEKLEAGGGFEGGPTREQLERIRDQEAAHFHLLHERMIELDGDPTAVTPSADLAAVTSMGVVAVVSDARTNLAESLEAILVAELADRDGWVRLVELAEQAGQDELARACRQAEREEEEHLANVRSWLSAYALASPIADEE
jgi:rubrerythrin